MAVTTKLTGKTLTACLEGEIDHHTARPMREHIDRETERMCPRRLVLDFSKVGFMDSSGIGLIMGRFKLMSELGGELAICSVPHSIERMIKLAGLGRLNIIWQDTKE